MTTVVITVRPSPLAAWFHHLLTRPVIEIDGEEQTAKWGTQHIEVPSGTRHVSVYFRYRGQVRSRLGESGKDVSIAEGSSEGSNKVYMRARLGIRNSSRFRIDGPVEHLGT